MNHVAHPSHTSQPVGDPQERYRLWHPKFELCAVCLRPARGFGWFDPHRSRAQRTYRWFCSSQCQSAFTRKARKGLDMQGMTEHERLAVALVMKQLARVMEEIGWHKRLCDLSETDVSALIEEVLEGYGTEMSRLARSQEVPL